MERMKKMDIYASFSSNGGEYQLIQLPKPLLSELEGGSLEKVHLKAPSVKSTPFLVTKSSVFKLRVQNHSNFQMVMNCDDNEGIGFKDFTCSLVPQKVDGELDMSKVSLLNDIGELERLSLQASHASHATHATLATTQWNEFKLNSLASEVEFDELVRKESIFHFNKVIIKPGDKIKVTVMLQVINEWINALNSTGEDWEFDDLSKSTNDFILQITQSTSESLNYPMELCKAVMGGYLTPSHGIDHAKVLKLISLGILGKQGRVKRDELHIQLRMALNSEYTPDLDPIELMAGEFYSLGEEIVKIDVSSFPDMKSRMNELFRIKSSWEKDEMASLISDLNVNKMPINKFMLKHMKISNGKCQLKSH